MLGSASSDQYEQVLPPSARRTHAVDALIVIFVPAASITVEDVGAAIERATRGHAKPVLPVLMGGAHPGSFPYPESAARALGRAAERADWLRRPIGAELAVDGVDSHAAAEVIATALGTADDLWLAPGEVRRLLEAYGISLVPERLAADAGEAQALAVELGFPAVVKTAEPGAHKTEQGGVALDLATSGGGAGGGRANRRAAHRAADDRGWRRAPRRSRPGSRLWAARRVRSRRRPGGAHRRGALPARSGRRHGRAGARHRRQGRPPGRGLPRAPGRRTPTRLSTSWAGWRASARITPRSLSST